MKLRFHWFDYDHFPYEAEFAKAELDTLFNGIEVVEDTEDALTVEVSNTENWAKKAVETTYFQYVESEDEVVVTNQAKLEVAEDSSSIESSDHSLSNYRLGRQQTRYSSHGIHEYRGKFNPQVVRSIGNRFGLECGDWLLDPFSGSGTALVEAKHRGWNAVGIEINPLAVKIANAKVDSLEVPEDRLNEEMKSVIEDLRRQFQDYTLYSPFPEENIESLAGKGWKEDIQGIDYLESWFVDSVLVQIHAIQRRLLSVSSDKTQEVLEILLSDELRDASLQDSGDLRTRKMDDKPANYPLVTKFIERIEEFLQTVLRSRTAITGNGGNQFALESDSRDFANEVLSHPSLPKDTKFDGALTSPPYASALPYVDTYRLSMYLFGLIKTGEMREKSRSLIGSRNIKETTRREIYDSIETNEHHLPKGCISTCRNLKEAVDSESDGFRRQNRPALVYQYLVDMKQSFKETYGVLKDKAPYGLIVGRNTTELGGEEYVIDNPELLAELGEQVGYKVDERVEMDTHRRYSMHNSNNSIDTEQLLVLVK
ncbi:DNA methyltransferase [Halorussus aquaticus]|uniref:DNA methyltransferase n=1 Tax=Halorussus aquaticus TaxID=2953748 RepID=A0ABD5Q623_9EURY|nr:DNA methyltransferase [Halorussus aquaticus]